MLLAAGSLLCNRVKIRKSLRLFCQRLSCRGVFRLGVERVLYNWWKACGVRGLGISCHMRTKRGGHGRGKWGVGCLLKKTTGSKGKGGSA